MEKMDKEGNDNQSPKEGRRPRLIVRLGIFLISHSSIVSVFCCISGLLALFLLPLLAKNTYISENALMPGSANPVLSAYDLVEADNLAKEILDWKLKPTEAGIEVPRLVARYMENLDAEVYHHEFYSLTHQFHPLNFFSGTPYSGSAPENSSCNSAAINSVGVIRAPRGDGKEAIVLVTPYNPGKIGLSDALSLGLAFSIFSLLSRVTWLSKDIVWLAADSRYGEYASVAAWLRDYHNPVFSSGLGKLEVDTCLLRNFPHAWEDYRPKGTMFGVSRRAGTMAAALVFKVVDEQKGTGKDTLSIYAEASNGQMPNLDLINIVHYLAVHRQGLRVKVERVFSLLNSSWLKICGEILEWVSRMAGSINPQWRLGIVADDFVEGIATLASSIYYQALGVPTGSHGAFRDYQVDAITIEISSKISLDGEGWHSAILWSGGRLIEGVIRSINNLLEKFHQSFFLYFLTSPGKFVSVGVYMIGFALLITPLPILAAALYSGSKTSNDQKGFAVGPWRWLHAAKAVFVVHLWGFIVSLLPYFICQLRWRTSMANMLTWVMLSFLVLIILFYILGSPFSYIGNAAAPGQSKVVDWTVLKAATIAAASIGLSLMSIINFAAAQIGAILIVPMCLMVQPLKDVCRTMNLRAVLIASSNVALAVMVFPPAALLILKGSLEGFGSVGIGDFWDWAESLWIWNSATYLYLALVHLPCWVLCMNVLLHQL